MLICLLFIKYFVSQDEIAETPSLGLQFILKIKFVNRVKCMLGERLNLVRKKSGLSLRGLADCLQGQISAQAIGKYERDEMQPSSTVLMALCQALEVSPELLFRSPRIELCQRGLS